MSDQELEEEDFNQTIELDEDDFDELLDQRARKARWRHTSRAEGAQSMEEF